MACRVLIRVCKPIAVHVPAAQDIAKDTTEVRAPAAQADSTAEVHDASEALEASVEAVVAEVLRAAHHEVAPATAATRMVAMPSSIQQPSTPTTSRSVSAAVRDSCGLPVIVEASSTIS